MFRWSLVLLVACGPSFRYTAFDATKATSIEIKKTVTINGAIAFCGIQAVLPPVAVAMAGGKVRATAGVAQDDLLDGSELVWSSSMGAVRHDPGGNRDVFDAGADYWNLLDDDVQVTVALAKNRAVTASITLLPTYVCPQVADFSGPPGQSGFSGENGSPGGQRGHGGHGGDGGPGGPGSLGPQVTVDLTIAGTKKRGKLVFARVHSREGGNAAYVFAATGGSLAVIANGGAGGAGGQGGYGGHGGDGTSSGNDCIPPGSGGGGGRGGDGGDGGDGGNVLVRVDRAYPELAPLVRVATDGGRGGEPGYAGEGGRGGEPRGSYTESSGSSSSTTVYCSSKLSQGQSGMPGQQGTRPGRDGRPGRSAVQMESLTALFPEGVNLIDRRR